MFQVDIAPEEFHNSVKSEVAVHSDIKPFVEALTNKLAEKKFSLQNNSPWWQALKEKQKKNTEFVKVAYIFEIRKIIDLYDLLKFTKVIFMTLAKDICLDF